MAGHLTSSDCCLMRASQNFQMGSVPPRYHSCLLHGGKLTFAHLGSFLFPSSTLMVPLLGESSPPFLPNKQKIFSRPTCRHLESLSSRIVGVLEHNAYIATCVGRHRAFKSQYESNIQSLDPESPTKNLDSPPIFVDLSCRCRMRTNLLALMSFC